MEDIILSIYVPTYNHEKYISRALDSILMQKTKYKYEVLVGEDASTDGTREILKKYEEEYPGIFKMFYREKNMHKEKVRNAGDLLRRCQGKYIIALEGDDFWIDENKIETQIRFLEENPEYIAVAHNCQVVDKDSNPTNEKYPECKDEEYTIKHYISDILPGQLTTVMRRNYRKYEIMDTSIIDKGLIPGDRVVYFALLANGKIRCMQKKMSAYRHVTSEGTSYSAQAKYSFSNSENLIKATIEYANKLDEKKLAKYMEFCYFKNIWAGIKNKQCSYREGVRYFCNIKYKLKAIFLYIKYFVNYHFLKKEIWF